MLQLLFENDLTVDAHAKVGSIKKTYPGDFCKSVDGITPIGENDPQIHQFSK